MSNLFNAIRIAMSVHHDQVDKDGKPYVLHPFRVMAHCGELGEDYAVAAVLHDIIEDSEFTAEALGSGYGFNDTVVEAVEALTRRPGEDYLRYIERVKQNDIARTVKRCDIQDNLRFSRDPAYASRCERYKEALAILDRKPV